MVTKKKAMVRPVIRFLDGPKAGDTITVDDPAPTHLKLGMPEWAVYELVEAGYQVKLVGAMARLWRDPERTSWVVS